MEHPLNPGSRYEIDLDIIGNSCRTELVTRLTSLVYDGTDGYPISPETVIYDLGDNPFSNLGFATGTILITDKAGNTHTVTVSSGDTIQDLIDAMNATSAFSAGFDQDKRALVIKDISGGAGKLSVEDLPGATLAEDLGIRAEVTGDTLTGYRISRVADTVLELTAPDGSTATVSGGWYGGSGQFAAVGNTDQAVTGSSSENPGGFAGISFSLKDKTLKVGDNFSIQAGSGTLNLQVSQSSGDRGRANLEIGDTSTAALGISDSVNINSRKAAMALVDSGRLDEALDQISRLRGNLGAFQNRIEHTIQNLGTAKENIQSAESRIREADMAKEQVNFVKRQIMQQFGIATASQASLLAESVLALLQ